MSDFSEAPNPSQPEEVESIATAPRIQLTDVYTPEGMNQLGDQIRTANGRCFVLVHPFFNFEGVNSVDEITDPAKRGYIEELKTTLQKIQAHNNSPDGHRKLPILIFAGSAAEGLSRRYDERVQATTTELARQLHDLLAVEGEFYQILTGSDPSPLDVPKLPDSEARKLIGEDNFYERYDPLSSDAKSFVSFVLRLKEQGLTHAIVAGENFGGPSDYFEGRYLPAERYPQYSMYKKSNNKPEWLLWEHYFERRRGKDGKPKHPLEVISPEGCVAETLRTFALAGVRTDLSQITYPKTLPVLSQIQPDRAIKNRI